MTRTMPDTLRAVADLLDAHPELPRPCVWGYAGSGNVSVQWQLMHGVTEDEQKAAAQRIIRAIGGKWNKDASGETFHFEQVRDNLTLVVEWRCESVLAEVSS